MYTDNVAKIGYDKQIPKNIYLFRFRPAVLTVLDRSTPRIDELGECADDEFLAFARGLP